MPAGAFHGFRRADAVLGFFLHELLDDPVFQRMIADNHQSAAESQQADGLIQSRFQIFHFVVNDDAQGLEGPGGGMNFAVSSADGLFHDIGQLTGSSRIGRFCTISLAI